jgi:hypothetical protein
MVRMEPFEVDGVVKVCPEPRGTVYDSTLLWVACADGDLVGVAWGGPVVQQFHVAPDLAEVHAGVGLFGLIAATAHGGDVFHVDLRAETIMERYPLFPEGTADTGDVVVHRLANSLDEGVYVLYEVDGQSLVSRVGYADRQVSTVPVDATDALDVAGWGYIPTNSVVPTPIVGAADIGGGPGVLTVDPPTIDDDTREPDVQNLVLPTAGPVVGLAFVTGRPAAVTRDPFTIETSLDGRLFP